jgi:prephenate dehydrogenase
MDASRRALKLGAVEKTEWNLIAACETADAIFLAAPAAAIRQTFEAIAPYLKKGVVISDTASTKQQVIAWADELLPEHANFVGGDPVLPDGASRDTPSAGLFDKGIYCLCPSVRASPESVEFVSAVASGFGSQPFFLDAVEHDGLVAGSEHLPLLATAALIAGTQESPSWREMRKIANVGYEAIVNLLPGTAPVYAGACLTNAENLTQWLDQYIEKLEGIRKSLAAKDEKAINALFEAAVAGGDKWKSERKRAQWDLGEVAAPATEQPGFIRQTFLGGGFKRKPPADKEKKS